MGHVYQLAPEVEREFKSTAIHEAGHEITANFFNLRPRSIVGGDSEGVCIHEDGKPLAVAAVSWAGALSEDLLLCRSNGRKRPTVELKNETLHAWYEEMRNGGVMELSAADRSGIGWFPGFEPCEVAYRILRERIDLLRFTADLLLADARPRAHLDGRAVVESFIAEEERKSELKIARDQQANMAKIEAASAELASIPWPDNFPAKPSDFLRLVVANGRFLPEHTATFFEFVTAQVRAMGGSGTAVQQAELLNFWEAGIPRSLWVELTRAYQQWREENQKASPIDLSSTR